jgi:glycosyltransferase involved in cell wall biosynthesis
MRLALITRRFPPLIGGAEKVLSYLAPALAAVGAEVTVLTARSPGLPRTEERPVAGGSLRIVRLPTSPARFLGTWLYMKNLGRWLERNAPDLAYVSMLKHDAYVAVGQGRRLGFPVVLRPEGAGATGDLAWQRWGRFGSVIARRCRGADAIVSISAAITHELLGADYEPGRIHELPNGVPIPESSWQPRAEWNAAPRAVFVGRLAPEKGLDTLLAAWPLVRDQQPRAQLTLVGEGPERSALESQAAVLRLEGSVRFVGRCDAPESVLRASDLFVLPSREEGMSIALLEAMALGIPVVASDIPGNRRLVADFDQGRLAPPSDPEALATTILEQWSDFDRAITMARRARDRVAREYSIAAVAQRHMVLFQALIADKAR